MGAGTIAWVHGIFERRKLMQNGGITGQMNIFDFLPKPKIKESGAIHRYLRYGPHTLIPEVRERTKRCLEEDGVPDWVKWKKDSLPCANCTWFDGNTCRYGAHSCHYEFDYLICDVFRQSIVERKPTTVGR